MLEGTHFKQKMVIITLMKVYNEVFLGDNILAILNSSKNLLECARQLFIIQSSF
jgi:hypothetical protein